MLDRLADYTMVCLSTTNQTINIIPALQFGIRNVVIVSTPMTGSGGNSSVTRCLSEVMLKRGIKPNIVTIDNLLEKQPQQLCNRLLKETQDIEKVSWNVSGGQKLPSIACHMAFTVRKASGHTDDVILYVEGNRPETWHLDSDYNETYIASNALLTLTELLKLYRSQLLESVELYPSPSEESLRNLALGEQALINYLTDEHFREAFFNFMEPDEGYTKHRAEIIGMLKESLRAVQPNLKDLRINLVGYKNLEIRIKSIFEQLSRSNQNEALKLIRELKIFKDPELIFNDYWSLIKNAAITHALSCIETKGKQLAGSLRVGEKEKLIERIFELGGQAEPTDDLSTLFKCEVTSFSRLVSNGFLFEWMVAARVMKCINENEAIKEKVSNVHINCKLPDAELDLVITTRFGTLIILEMKAFEFSGDLARSKENTAYKRSGPYGRAIMVGPLLREMITTSASGKIVYPGYIPGAVKDQEKTAAKSGIEYVFLDGLEDMLKRKLYV